MIILCELCKKAEATKKQIIIGKDVCLKCYRRYAKAYADVVEGLFKKP